MNYILFDGAVRNSLLPFTYTRPVADIRVGILTIREKWERRLGTTTTTLTEEYLEVKYPMVEMEQNVMLNASFLPTDALIELVENLSENQAIFKGDEVIAFYTSEEQEEVDFEAYDQIEFDQDVIQIQHTWDIFSLNEKALQEDFDYLTEDRTSQKIPDSVHAINPENIFIEPGATIHFSSLNAEKGPIYIGNDALVMEGALIRGPFAMCDDAVVKMGAKIYGATTLGPACKVGGELNNVVLFANSSKGHDGYLGNAVLGEWCNLGADTNNSNLKNNYAEVRVWDYDSKRFAKTGLQFCGLMMGDHSKCGINTMFNTGTVVGVSANIYGSNFPRNFIPSFSWGGAAGFTTYQIEKVLETVKLVMARKNVDFDEVEAQILTDVFELTSANRNF